MKAILVLELYRPGELISSIWRRWLRGRFWRRLERGLGMGCLRLLLCPSIRRLISILRLNLKLRNS